MIKKIKHIFILTSRQKKFILVLLWLSIYRNILLLIGSKQGFTEHICKDQKRKLVLTPDKIAITKDITLAIKVIDKYLPWKNVCRHQSWQAVVLLLKNEVPFDYYVGVRKKEKVKEGHSWVKVDGKFVCGNCIEKEYHIIS